MARYPAVQASNGSPPAEHNVIDGGSVAESSPAPGPDPFRHEADRDLAHTSAPPEAGGALLTPWNDPESTFAQRPVPPGALEHSVIVEVRVEKVEKHLEAMQTALHDQM